jgi:hypothetical protein
MLEEIPGVCQAYFLRSPDSEDRIALTFWDSADSMATGGAAIGAWQGREAAAGRVPAFVGGDALGGTGALRNGNTSVLPTRAPIVDVFEHRLFWIGADIAQR